MPRGRSTFRQQDVTRALRAAKAAGLEVSGYEVDATTGKIIVTTGSSEQKPASASPFDIWMKNRERKAKGRTPHQQ